METVGIRLDEKMNGLMTCMSATKSTAMENSVVFSRTPAASQAVGVLLPIHEVLDGRTLRA